MEQLRALAERLERMQSFTGDADYDIGYEIAYQGAAEELNALLDLFVKNKEGSLKDLEPTQ